MTPENPVNSKPVNNQQVSDPAPTPQQRASSTIMTPEGIGLQIDNVNRSLWQYVRQRKLWELLLLVPFVVIWEIFVVLLFVKYLRQSSGGSSSSGRGFGSMLMLPVIVFSSWLYKLRKQFEDAFLQEFALSNNYSFDKTGVVDETYGSIFRLKGSQSVSDVVSGTYADTTLRLFLYELVVGSGRYQQRYQDTVMELDLHGQLPELLMVNKHSSYGQLNIAGSFGVKNTIVLEGDFNQYFTLYAQQGNEVEALEVFSPDIMALMEDQSKHYTVEFVGNRIYIYVNGFVGTTENIMQLFTLAKKLVDKIAPLAARLQNDSAIVTTPVNLVQTKNAHPFAKKLGSAVTIILIVVGISLLIFSLWTAPHQTASNQSQAPSNPATAISISKVFMQDFGRGDTNKTISLESPRLQQDAHQTQYLEMPNFRGIENSTLIDQGTGTNDKGPWVSVIYEDDSGSKPFYIKLILSQYGQDWRVWFFQTSYNKLSP